MGVKLRERGGEEGERDEEVGRREAIKLTETLATPSSLPPGSTALPPWLTPATHDPRPCHPLLGKPFVLYCATPELLIFFTAPEKLSLSAAELPRCGSNFAGVSPTAAVKERSDGQRIPFFFLTICNAHSDRASDTETLYKN